VPAGTLAILNPCAGNAAKLIGRIETRLRGSLADVLGGLEIERTRGPRDASRIAREAVRAGVKRLVVGGGDGTLAEVVTGLLAAGLGEDVEIGILPLGMGSDFARGLGIPMAPEKAIEGLAAGVSLRVDAGRIVYRDREGAEQSSYFLNEASFGLSGLIVEAVNRSEKRLGPRLSFAAGSLAAIARHPQPDVVLRVDDKEVYAGPVALVLAANGRFCGAGMKMAPGAEFDDGLLDVVVVKALSRTRLWANLPSIYRGGHIDHPMVSVHRGVRVEAEVRGADPALLDVDGEALGQLPIRVELLPRAIGVFGVPKRPQAT
jgi:YegS/Rv2252/BmrU family lipid kinase